ncbi:hypothetical protein, partial [Leuconostoc mesenteroides]|uniref:hypothetical protein n=1 Tax=Leuconostoc mesenteroides TaxID=1245 RepID=UPI001C9987D1
LKELRLFYSSVRFNFTIYHIPISAAVAGSIPRLDKRKNTIPSAIILVPTTDKQRRMKIESESFLNISSPFSY